MLGWSQVFMNMPRRGILENRTILILTILLCAVFSVWSWLSVRHVYLPENPASIFGVINVVFYTLLIFGIGSVAFKSRFWGDRAVFGIVAGVIALIAVKAMVPLTLASTLAVNAAKSSMWTIAALISLTVLVRGSKHPPGMRQSD
jgi:hypothetical protein